MTLLNGHDINKGDVVMVAGKKKIITHVCRMYLHIHDLMFYKSSGIGANTAATGLKIERLKSKLNCHGL